jgi:hypothetical protein
LHEKTTIDIDLKPLYQQLPDVGVRINLRQQPTNLSVDIFRFCISCIQPPVPALYNAFTPGLIMNHLTSSLRRRRSTSQDLGYLIWLQMITEEA